MFVSSKQEYILLEELYFEFFKVYQDCNFRQKLKMKILKYAIF